MNIHPSPFQFSCAPTLTRGQLGLLPNELPLRPNLGFRSDAPNNVVVEGRPALQMACHCVVANALLARWHGEEAWVFYSRDNTYYASVRLGVPAWYTRASIVTVVDKLAGLELLEQRRTRPSPTARYRSRFRATRRLVEVAEVASLSELQWDEAPPVILRSRDERRLLDPFAALDEQAQSEWQGIAHDVEEHNAFLSNYTVELSGAQALPSGLLKVGNGCVNPQLRNYYRVFNGDLEHGGRWYGPWWQHVPSVLRANLTINGDAAVEVDFAASQLRLMFAHLGLPDPLGGAIRSDDAAHDLYRIDGLSRDAVKLGLLIMINAQSSSQARRALAKKLAALQAPHDEVPRIIAAIRDRFPDLKQLWYSGIGVRLQRVDSDLCAVIQREMRARRVPVLSVHDSFISWSHALSELHNVMRGALADIWQVAGTNS